MLYRVPSMDEDDPPGSPPGSTRVDMSVDAAEAASVSGDFI